jgi:GNAT superfamily N-acetyltransferase
MIIKRTKSNDPDFAELVRQSDKLYRELFGPDMDYYDQFNKTGTALNTVVIYGGSLAVACGCFRPFSDDTVEIKRMFVVSSHRKQGTATEVLQELERWAKEFGYRYCILETNLGLPGAINFYRKNGYEKIENWGQYIGIETSQCMKKNLMAM